MENPALHEHARSKPANVIPLQRDASILDWLESTGRLLARDPQESDFKDEEAEINELMAGDDASYDTDDDDDDEELVLDD